MEQLIEFALSGVKAGEEVSKALKSLVNTERSKTTFYPHRLGRILMPFFKQRSEEALNACYFQDNDGSYNTALRMLSIHLEECGETAVGVVPDNELIKWCKLALDDRCIFAAQTCKLYEKSKSDGLGDENSLRISNTAKSILAHAPDKKRILEVFIDRFYSAYCPGSRSATMRHRLQLLDQFNPIQYPCPKDMELH